MNQLNVMLFNATGLPKQAKSSILSIAEHSSVLLMVETWFYYQIDTPTHWKRYHTDGIKTHPLATKDIPRHQSFG